MKRSNSIVAGLIATLALTLVGSGCVTAKKYEALQADLAKTQGELTKAQGEIKDLSVALGEAEAEAEGLRGQIADLEQKLAVAESRATDAENQLAEVLKDKSNLTASIEDMQRALAELQKKQALAEARAAEYRNVLAKFKSLIDNGKLKAKIVDGRMVLELQTDILFASGSADLSKEGAATIREVGALLGTIPDRKFQVEGHTDNVPIKTKSYPSNWELASARAINVVKEMVEAGMPGKRISAASYADTRPTSSNETDQGRAQNRRIEIVIQPDLSDLPGADQIEKMFNSPGA
ncbi:MAG TPA: flagellar motor protein MotB [Enhygromyxa sp.]|nr:flagellar motor protein MotB [Enhygromyxa sp.]